MHPKELIALSDKDWWENEKNKTMFTDIRFLPDIMKKAGLVDSMSEVRRNRPELVKTLNDIDCVMIRWGKKRLFIVVGG